MDPATTKVLTDVIPIASFAITVIIVVCTAAVVISKVRTQAQSMMASMDHLRSSIDRVSDKVDQVREAQIKSEAEAEALRHRVSELEKGFRKLNAS